MVLTAFWGFLLPTCGRISSDLKPNAACVEGSKPVLLGGISGELSRDI